MGRAMLTTRCKTRDVLANDTTCKTMICSCTADVGLFVDTYNGVCRTCLQTLLNHKSPSSFAPFFGQLTVNAAFTRNFHYHYHYLYLCRYYMQHIPRTTTTTATTISQDTPPRNADISAGTSLCPLRNKCSYVYGRETRTYTDKHMCVDQSMDVDRYMQTFSYTSIRQPCPTRFPPRGTYLNSCEPASSPLR